MSVTNAISSVIIVGAIIAGLSGNSNDIFNISSIFGFLAIGCCNKYFWWISCNSKNASNV